MERLKHILFLREKKAWTCHQRTLSLNTLMTDMNQNCS